MKKTAILIFSMLIFITGCDQTASHVTEQGAVNSSEALPIEEEIIHPESAAIDTSAPIKDAQPPLEQDWKDLYYEKLMEYRDNPMMMFNICELNGDETPELMLSEGDYHAVGAKLYTVLEGKLVDLGEYGSGGEFQYDFERNLLHSAYFQMGSGFLTVYRFENGEIAKIVSFFSYDGGFSSTPEEKYTIDDETVSKDVFNAEYETYLFDTQEEFIVRKYEATQNVIVDVLGLGSDVIATKQVKCT